MLSQWGAYKLVLRSSNSVILINEKNGVGVLLNTSFNVAGKPILNSIKAAFQLFETTEMDNLLIENTYLEKMTSRLI